jgi:chromosome segregation ATPase
MYQSQPALTDDPHSLHLLTCLDAYLHALIASLQVHLDSLRGTLSEAQTQARQLSYSVKHSEQQEDLLKTQGTELRELVGELEARGEAVPRELNARRDEILAVTQIKEAEIRHTRAA